MASNRFLKKIFKKIFKMLCSLKLAVLVILSLAVALSAGTILESLYDTRTAQYWVYRSIWFYGVLVALALNIFCVAVSRYPWKRRHIPFLLAHLGILILLTGSWLTERIGVDGNLRITEGETASVVELDEAALVIHDRAQMHVIPIRWIPPQVEFKPFSTSSYRVPVSLQVDRFLSHADPVVSFVPNPEPSYGIQEKSHSGNLKEPPLSAVHFQLAGGPMGITQDFWLWEGAPAWKAIQAGPARFSLGKTEEGKAEGGAAHQPWLAFYPQKDGSLKYVAHSSEGKRIQGNFQKNKIVGSVIHPGWKGNIRITLLELIPDAMASTTYKPSRIQYGNEAPSSAIHLTAAEGVDLWLGVGDRAVLHLGDQDVDLGYFPKRVVLPFSVRLDRFTIEHDPGTMSPASYSSQVTVFSGNGQGSRDGGLGAMTQKDATISMNEPLELQGYALYQASYENGEPRPTTSIFSVNRDPGRPWKYLGSALIVLGSILLFAAKYRLARKKVSGAGQSASTSQPTSSSQSASAKIQLEVRYL